LGNITLVLVLGAAALLHLQGPAVWLRFWMFTDYC